jgi:hypothetical protein
MAWISRISIGLVILGGVGVWASGGDFGEVSTMVSGVIVAVGAAVGLGKELWQTIRDWLKIKSVG